MKRQNMKDWEIRYMDENKEYKTEVFEYSTRAQAIKVFRYLVSEGFIKVGSNRFTVSEVR